MSFNLTTLLRWVSLHGDVARQTLQPRPPRRGRIPRSRRLPLLLYSQVAWDDVWQRPQEMACGLARYRPVIFCSPVQLHQAAGQLAGRWKPFRRLQGGRLLVDSPLILSGEYRSGLIRAINRVILARHLNALMGNRRFILLTNSPFVDWLVPALRPAAVGYDAIDDFCAFEWSPPDSRARENALLRRADLVTAGTWSLQEDLSNRARDCDFLASGVDFDKLTARVPEPEELAGLCRPRLLYVGTLNDRVSADLISETARCMPEASIVLVGPRRATFGDIRFPRNVHELGLRPHEELSGFYQHCDLGLMPFADNEAARAINPVKTLEYLACGLPVISTPVPDVRRFYEPPVVVADPQDWAERIPRMLREDSAEARTARVDFARGRRWSTLVEKVEQLLRQTEDRVKI